jgi:hypothetical protein
MEVVKVAPLQEGKQTQITLSMTAEEAELFMRAFNDGKLANFGITTATVEPEQNNQSGQGQWSAAERAKKSKQTDESQLPDHP